MKIDLISIVVPIYNSEKTLIRCIESIICQTYKNIELIMIDDGSIDSSGEICDEYASRDSRIKVFHTKNSGISAARNMGLNNITGDYVMFVDSDDWIEKDMCSTMLMYAKKSNVLLVTSLANNISDEEKNRTEVLCREKEQIIPVDDEFSFMDDYALGVIWGTLYDVRCIKSLRFEANLYVGEDTVFYAQAIRNCQKILFIPERFYNYVFYRESAAHGRIDSKKMTNLQAWDKVSELFKDNKKISDSAKGAYGRQCVFFLKAMWNSNDRNNSYWNFCKCEMRKNMKYLLRDKRFKNKLIYSAMYISPELYLGFKQKRLEFSRRR